MNRAVHDHTVDDVRLQDSVRVRRAQKERNRLPQRRAIQSRIVGIDVEIDQLIQAVGFEIGQQMGVGREAATMPIDQGSYATWWKAIVDAVVIVDCQT